MLPRPPLKIARLLSPCSVLTHPAPIASAGAGTSTSARAYYAQYHAHDGLHSLQRPRSPRDSGFVSTSTGTSMNRSISGTRTFSSSSPFLFTTTTTAASDHVSPPLPPPPPPPSRWYSDLQARLGKCIMFGCNAAQVRRAAGVLRALAGEWRALSVGSEGFLTGPGRGLEGQKVVWGEMDSFGHVNNTHYIRYAESARVNWIIHFGGLDPAHRAEWRSLMTPRGTGLIMKSIKADYKFPMTYPDSISVYHKLRAQPSPSDTSLILDCVILSHRHRRVAARTEEDIVVYDYRQAQKTRVPPFALDLLRDTWRLQEEETRRARERVWGLIREVESLEKETWDREDAVEDLGAAAKS
ncbi:Thioesterase/thiol ester dehydrase-isomerase [Biscogniauxia marginata]|nr:Thioesterase/thiol ester dehydrase-isomerase [Biscogniauxia marginata]